MLIYSLILICLSGCAAKSFTGIVFDEVDPKNRVSNIEVYIVYTGEDSIQVIALTDSLAEFEFSKDDLKIIDKNSLYDIGCRKKGIVIPELVHKSIPGNYFFKGLKNILIYAPFNGQIVGQLSVKNGKPITGGTIALYHEGFNDTVLRTVSVNGSGQFEIENIEIEYNAEKKQTPFRLRIECGGYTPKEIIGVWAARGGETIISNDMLVLNLLVDSTIDNNTVRDETEFIVLQFSDIIIRK